MWHVLWIMVIFPASHLQFTFEIVHIIVASTQITKHIYTVFHQLTSLWKDGGQMIIIAVCKVDFSGGLGMQLSKAVELFFAI